MIQDNIGIVGHTWPILAAQGSCLKWLETIKRANSSGRLINSDSTDLLASGMVRILIRQSHFFSFHKVHFLKLLPFFLVNLYFPFK